MHLGDVHLVGRPLTRQADLGDQVGRRLQLDQIGRRGAPDHRAQGRGDLLGVGPGQCPVDAARQPPPRPVRLDADVLLALTFDTSSVRGSPASSSSDSCTQVINGSVTEGWPSPAMLAVLPSAWWLDSTDDVTPAVCPVARDLSVELS